MRIPAHKDTIMIHCLATKPEWGEGKTAQQMVDEVTRWHVDGNGWSDIAYAGIIDYEGRWAPGRDLNNDGNTFDDTGAGAKGHNRNVIHIALAGGHGSSANDRFPDHYTMAQDKKLREQIALIQWAAGRKMKIRGHNEVSNKACPGFHVGTWYAQKRPRSMLRSKTLQGATLDLAGLSGTAMAVWTAFSSLPENTQIALIGTLALSAAGIAVVYGSRLFDWIVKERR